MCRSWDMISLQIPLPPSALYMNELNSPWILQPSVCLCSESADNIFPVFRVAFWKPGLQNEWYGPRDLCVSICLHSGCYCCWQVRWLLCVILYSKSLPFPRILLFYKLWAECYPRISSWRLMESLPELRLSLFICKNSLLLVWIWLQKDRKLHPVRHYSCKETKYFFSV